MPAGGHGDGHNGHGHSHGGLQRGFNLGASELLLSANIDSHAFGALTLGLDADNEVAVEEAYVQSTSLPHGLQAKVGRFFSGVGYVNGQHAHAWDFADAPLAYQAFLGGQLSQDGVQLSWLAPTAQYLSLSAELGRGDRFPASGGTGNGAGSMALTARTGGDLGASQSWQLGLSHAWFKARDRHFEAEAHDHSGAHLHTEIENAFNGRIRLWLIDGVWKWAPQGDASRTSLKVQGEYFRRDERGQVIFDVADHHSLDRYRSAQSGWYVQGVYQFLPRWRLGLRHDRLDSGRTDFGPHNSAHLGWAEHRPSRHSLMLDFSPSEFQRWRLQLSDDRSSHERSDAQIVLQYQMSLGAHGAHAY